MGNRVDRSLYALAAAGAIALTGCGGGGKNSSGGTAAPAGSPAASTASNSITVAGSTALLPLAKQAAVDYQGAHPNVKISVSGGGSLVGITQAAQKAIDVGDSDIPAPDQPSLVDHRVAVVAFGIVVNPQTGVKSLSLPQIRGLLTGAITNWNQVGGKSGTVTIINRPRSSGTRAVLVHKILGGREPSVSGLTQDSSGTVATMVAQTPGAISYLAMGYVKPGVQVAVSINGIAPSDADVENGTYPYWSYEHMFTNGQPSAPVAAFIHFVETDTTLLKQLHFIPLSAMKSSAH